MENASISNIADPIWDLFKEFILNTAIQKEAEKFLKILEDQDWDYQDEAKFVRKYFKYKSGEGYVFRKPRK